MITPVEKKRADKNRLAVREVLVRDWDPLDLGAEADDEYDIYGAILFANLQQGKTDPVMLGGLLFALATQELTLPATPDLAARCKKAAAALVALRASLDFG